MMILYRCDCGKIEWEIYTQPAEPSVGYGGDIEINGPDMCDNCGQTKPSEDEGMELIQNRQDNFIIDNYENDY